LLKILVDGIICKPLNDDIYNEIKSALYVDDTLKNFKDIKKIWGTIILSSVIAMILGVLFLYLMRFSGFLIWVGIFFYFLIMFAAGFALFKKDAERP
jgi:hypothetical protein